MEISSLDFEKQIGASLTESQGLKAFCQLLWNS